MTEEGDLQRTILEALYARGYWAQRLNSGVAFVGEGENKRAIQQCEAGTPDILVIVPYGWLEVKTKTGKLRPSQRKWLQRAQDAGVRWAVVRSISAALDAVKEWSEEDLRNTETTKGTT